MNRRVRRLPAADIRGSRQPSGSAPV